MTDVRDFPPGRWSALWIWGPVATGPGRQVVALRRRIRLEDVPARVPCRLWADSRYVLFVNGADVAHGPIRINPRRAVYDTLDLAPHLRAGENVLAVLATYYDDAMPWWLPGPTMASGVAHGAFVLEARLGDDGLLVDDARLGGDAVLGTDERWRARSLGGWTADRPTGISGRGRERIDLRALPADWTGATFDDADWEPATVRRGVGVGESGRPEPPSYPFGPVRARSIAWPKVRPRALAGSDAGRTWDAGEVVFGRVRVNFEAPAGTEVAIAAREFPDDGDGAASSHEEPLGAFVVADGTRRTVELQDSYGLRTVEIEAPPDVTIHSVAVREHGYPVEGEAWFECSDETLNRIWKVGRRTVSLCSLDAYLDCPTREQRAWTGDSVVHQMVDLTTNADWRLARWHPRLAASPRADGMLPMAVAGDSEHSDMAIIPDWALHWVHSVWNLHRWIPGAGEVAELLPVVEGVLRWFEPWVDDDGLPRDVPGWVIIDWASVYTEGNCAALCGLWGRALLEFAEMADSVDDRGRSRWARAAHARLAAGFERLWDASRRRYADSRVGDVLRPMASQHAQAAAVVGDLAPRDRWPRLVELLTDRANLVHATFSRADGPAAPGSNSPVGGVYLVMGHPDPWWDVEKQLVCAQPFFRYVVHDALAAAGRRDLIVDQCRDWAVLLERCPTSWSETWFGGTVSHGWSSTPTRDLMTRVLGVEPGGPGFASVSLEPALGDLAWARGAVPCPGGYVRVEAAPDRVRVESPLPIVYRGRRLEAGRHEWPSP